MRRITPNEEFIRLLLTGRSGSTKTRTAYSAVFDSRTSPVLGLNMFGQPRSIKDYRPAPTLLDMETLGDLTRVYNWLAAGQKASNPLVREWELTPPYQTVILDGFSEAQVFVVNNASGNASKGFSDKPSPIERQHYGTILAQTLAIAGRFYKLPMHVIGTVLEQERVGGEGMPVTYRHQLVGQAREQLSSYPEIVARLIHIEKVTGAMKVALKNEITAETVSVAIFKPGLRHEAKDQTGKLGDFMVDPSIPKMLELIYGE